MKKYSSVEEVLDFTINSEIEAHNFYMKLSEFVEKPEMAKVLSGMASEELGHKVKLEAVKAGEIEIAEEEVGNLGIAENVEDVMPDAKMSYIDLLVMAMKKEEAARKLYTDLAIISQEQELKDIFLKLAQEEADHKLRLEVEYDLMTF
ncbi:MAG: ferritin family protein [Planctomycetes bacterium]|nr:ferritin family protein [Planctomycetota bacterium]